MKWFCWSFLERSEYIKVQIDMNVIGVFYFEHFRIWSSALWWLNEICNQPKPLCIRAQFSKLLHFLHIPEEDLQNSALQWGTLQELQYFKNDLSLVFSYSWMNLNFAKRKYICTGPYVARPRMFAVNHIFLANHPFWDQYFV